MSMQSFSQKVCRVTSTVDINLSILSESQSSLLPQNRLVCTLKLRRKLLCMHMQYIYVCNIYTDIKIDKISRLKTILEYSKMEEKIH